MFKTTYLYIKQHAITGLKYFGKTTKSDPVKYKGSGTYWMRHLKDHGNHVNTLWYQLFENEFELREYALNFSREHQINSSKEWANIILEDGLDGVVVGTIPWNKGRQRTPEEKALMSQRRREGIEKKKQAGIDVCWNKGRQRTPEEKALMSQKIRETNERKRQEGLPIAWNTGKKTGSLSEEHKCKIGEAGVGRIPWNKGKKWKKK